MNIDIKNFVIDEKMTIVSAMKQLNQMSANTLYVVDQLKVKASLTDGDIRRWILSKNKLDALVKDVANYNPKVLLQRNRSEAKAFMKQHSIESVPIVNDDMELISIVLRDEGDFSFGDKIDIPVIIMAGGLGTRLYPYTKVLPKALIPIDEKPIIEHIIDRFNEFGCNDFYLLLNHKKNMIKAYFNELHHPYGITYIEEEEFLGTGGGLSLLKGKIHSTCILSNCDILIEENYSNIFDHHIKEKNLITMVCSLKTIKIPYGVIQVSEAGEIDNFNEKPELSFLVNTGLYFIEPRVIEEMEESTCISFPEIVERYMKNGYKVGIYPISDYAWMDMGQMEELEMMQRRFDKD